MATLSHAESRRLYSWWWDSHISPKNSKWLKENLTDMDSKVKAMIKLIEEDADSFRKRAEMYYRKRPELMKLVEEFYRAYRALAERYDHATGALRQAHKTMSEAFPDQLPLLLNDDSEHVMFNDMQSNGVHNEVNGTNYGEEELKSSNLQNGKESEEFLRLVEENKNLKNQILVELGRADKAEVEVQNLKSVIFKLESEKEVTSLRYLVSQEKIANLEADIVRRQKEFDKVNDEMIDGINKLRIVDGKCHELEKNKQSLEFDLNFLKDKAKKQHEELDLKQEELYKLNDSIKDEYEKSRQEDVNFLTRELKNMEVSKVGLEDEIRKHKEEILSLNDKIVALEFKIKNLENELSLLESSKRSLEEEIGVHVREKKVLQQEKFDLEQRHQELADKIGAVNMNVESLQAMVKDLRDGNEELKDICNKHENERSLHLESLKFMEKITEKNLMLENSLSIANAEVGMLREKIKNVEDLCESLRERISLHVLEKENLVSQIEDISKKMENLMEENASLENSVGEASDELKSLRGKLSLLESSCKSLNDQNSSLLAEKSILATQVESIGDNLSSLETKFTELECNNLNLEKEKNQVLDEVKELQGTLQKERDKHATFMQFSANQLATLENNIHIIQENVRHKEMELESEKHNFINAHTEIFVLQRILHDMKENNALLLDNYRRSLETCKSQEELILDREREIANFKASISDSQGENHRLFVENSVILAFFEQELKARFRDLLSLQNEKRELLEHDDKLRKYVQTCNHKEEVLKLEIAALSKKLADMQDIHSTLQRYVNDLMVDNTSFSKKINMLSNESGTLKESNIALIEEVMKLEHLYLLFRSCLIEKLKELQLLSSQMDNLSGINGDLKREIRAINESFGALEIRNINLDGSLHNSENEVKITKQLVLQKDAELLQLNSRIEEIEKKNLALIEKSSKNDDVVANLHQINNELREKHEKTCVEAENLKSNEIYLMSELEGRIHEIKVCEVEIVALLKELQITAVNAVIFEEKMLELISENQMITEEIVKRNAHEDQLMQKLGDISGENEGLKKEISAYMPLIISLGNFFDSLERHILSLANDQAFRNQETKNTNTEAKDKDNQFTSPFGIIELEKLVAKVKALEDMVKAIQNHEERENFSIEEMEASTVVEGEEDPRGKDIVLHLKRKDSTELSTEENSKQEIKDIQLDHVLSSSHESKDHMLELWDTTEYKQDLNENFIESSRQERSSLSSSTITDRLSNDARKLSSLQKSADELKSTMELYERVNTISSNQYRKVKTQLKEAESVISHLTDVNHRMSKKIGKLSSASVEMDEMGNASERKIYIRARRSSEKIGRLELELQKLEYIWLKIKEENDFRRARAAERRTRVMLRDYFYGRRESPKRRKARCCSCMRPRTKDDDDSS